MENWLIVGYEAVVSVLYIWLVTRPEDAVDSFTAKFRYLFLGLGTLAAANAIYRMMNEPSVSVVVATMLIAFITMVTASFNAGRYLKSKRYSHMLIGIVLGYVSMLIFGAYLMTIDLG
jgi:ABC-type uncharacterized transport system permease subunit